MKDAAIYPSMTTPAVWESLLELASKAGARIVSTSLNWASLEPSGPGAAGEFDVYDSFVSRARHLGLQVRVQLVGFPDWARDPGEPSNASEPWLAPTSSRALSLWSQFVAKVVHHFRGQISFYEIWNEPNISSFWEPFPDPAQYAQLLETSYLAVKANDPKAQVIFAGMSRNDVGFLQQTYTAIDRLFPTTAERDHHFFDVLGANPYAGDRSPAVDSPSFEYQDGFGLMDENFLGFERLHQVLVQHGEGNKAIYITEYGLSTLGWNGYPPVSDAVRAEYLRLAFSLARKARYVEAFTWYCLYPTPYNTADWAMLQGSYPNWQPTLTFKAWKSEPG